jgi:hypothetical protein
MFGAASPTDKAPASREQPKKESMAAMIRNELRMRQN